MVTTILVTVEGGVIQDITADCPGIRVIVKDFDRDAPGGLVWSDFPVDFSPDIIKENVGEFDASGQQDSPGPGPRPTSGSEL